MRELSGRCCRQVDVVERRVAIDPLVGGSDAVEPGVDGEVYAVGVVVDLAQQGTAGVWV